MTEGVKQRATDTRIAFLWKYLRWPRIGVSQVLALLHCMLLGCCCCAPQVASRFLRSAAPACSLLQSAVATKKQLWRSTRPASRHAGKDRAAPSLAPRSRGDEQKVF
jgi:hypothetical protein